MANALYGAAAALLKLRDDPQHHRLLTIDFPRRDGPADTVILVNKLVAREEVSRDFQFDVELLSDKANIPLKQVMGKMVTISLVREDGSLRHFNGYVFEFRMIKADGGFVYYGMVLRPWLAFTTLRVNSMSFLHKNVIGITEATFDHYHDRDWNTRLLHKDPPIVCANQYNESDHNHLHRRWEELGLYTWYEHRADGHTLWIGDDSTRSASIDAGSKKINPAQIPFKSKSGSVEDDAIHSWQAVRELGSGKTTLTSFDYKNPRPQFASAGMTNTQGKVWLYERYENAGADGFKTYREGLALAECRMDEHEGRVQYFVAEGDSRWAQAGRAFKLGGHFSAEPGQRPRGEIGAVPIHKRAYLILSVLHTASNNYHAGRAAPSHYDNVFTCIRQSIRWRPGRGFNSVPCLVSGMQTATVVGPPDSEIHTDNYGRVKVQFHWDRLGKFDDASSPFLRVMSSWAGSNFGHISLPRVGQEVAIVFLNGNVDHPIIIGSVYNHHNMPPWQLPVNSTQSGILTRSTKKGDGSHANALRFEDKKDHEQLWLHAEKDQLTEVEHDEDKWVGNDRRKNIDRDETTNVKRDRTETVGHDEKINVGNNRTERVDHNEDIDIGGDRGEHVGGNEKVSIDGYKSETILLAKALSIGAAYQTTVGGLMNTTVALTQAEEVGMSKTVIVGMESLLQAGNEIKFVVGSSVITMTATRISLVADEIMIEGRKKVEVHGDDIDHNPG
ncbi:type VI secretion system Vgr family protein [Massilia glaciei]|uniref:Type VI secretion system tip protein VgrG n=2 Tax=Pseudomonadati TaxID=3379134 RepID=A0A2U2HIR6_9BURK|nr:type VI secretion system tip protein TssI/VgrG [Massilia glaciei]PWF46704.1 type VI secretion system tip protein VgrG [Massilia glaciei]